MHAVLNHIDVPVNLLGTMLHNAALASQAIIDAIPSNADVHDELSQIAKAIKPVDSLAWSIVRTPSSTDAVDAAISRACAWLDGRYWETFGAAA